MDNYSKIYWLTRLDNIGSFFVVLIILSVIILAVYFILLVFHYDEGGDFLNAKRRGRPYKIASLWVLSISSIVLVFLPSKEDMILIYAGGKTLNYVQSDTSLSKIPYQTTKIISDYLDKTVKEMKDNK